MLWKRSSPLGNLTDEPAGTATTRGRSSRPSWRISRLLGSIFCAGILSSQTTAGEGSGSLCCSTPGPTYLIFARSFFWAAPSGALIFPVIDPASWGANSRSRARVSLMTEQFYPSTGRPARSGLKFDFPVGPAEELVPGLAAVAGGHLDQGLPRRLLRRLAELEARLRQRMVGLALVALHAGQ